MVSFKSVALKAAKAAAEIQLKHFGKIHSFKPKNFFYNIVTKADNECEEKIISIIKKNFPEHNIIAEESGSQKNDSEFSWIIDPLDGTTNFSHAYPHFCTSIALQKEGETILGVVFDPCLKELFFTEKGKDAFLNKKKLHVSNKRNLNDCLVATGFWYDRGKYLTLNLENVERVMKQTQGVRRGGAAALDLAYIAAGRLDAHWEFHLQPWDTAAAVLMIEEAGGKVTNASGERYSPFDEFILASNGLVHSDLRKLIKLKW